MFELVAVTNRRLCEGDFLSRIELVAASGVAAIILREKDLSPDEYEMLAVDALKRCEKYEVPLTLHHFAETAQKLGASRLHLSLSDLEANPWARGACDVIGVSIHSLEQALRAQSLDADYVVAGHIFETNSKKGLAPRGIPFLAQICRELTIPVYAIGGINTGNIQLVKEAGARGACLMSAFMTGLKT